MAGRLLKQSMTLRWIVLIGCLAYGFLGVGRLLLEPVASNPDDSRINDSTWMMVILWPVSAALLLVLRSERFGSQAAIVRILYTLVFGGCLLHIAVAFHLGHGWSHADAYNRTERVSGFGAGIYVSYFFVLLWAVEVVWMWLALDNYLERPRWLNALVLGFMWFIFFNATVVYGHSPERWFGLVFLILPFVLYRKKIYSTPFVDGMPLARGSGSTA